MVEAWHVTVTGRVQGVGFRFSTFRQAKLTGVNGWVRNAFDGSVEVFVQGENLPVARFLQWLSQGPPLSHVTGLVKMPAAVDENCRDFEITF